MPSCSCVRSNNEPFYPLDAFHDSRLRCTPVCHKKLELPEVRSSGTGHTIQSFLFEAEQSWIFFPWFSEHLEVQPYSFTGERMNKGDTF